MQGKQFNTIDNVMAKCCNLSKFMEVIKMAKTSTLNIRIEPKLKEEAETTLNDLGMNIAEA